MGYLAKFPGLSLPIILTVDFFSSWTLMIYLRLDSNQSLFMSLGISFYRSLTIYFSIVTMTTPHSPFYTKLILGRTNFFSIVTNATHLRPFDIKLLYLVLFFAIMCKVDHIVQPFWYDHLYRSYGTLVICWSIATTPCECNSSETVLQKAIILCSIINHYDCVVDHIIQSFVGPNHFYGSYETLTIFFEYCNSVMLCMQLPPDHLTEISHNWVELFFIMCCWPHCTFILIWLFLWDLQ